ncbi:MAG: PIN domain-containing protein [Myxococcales bacterium]|nr:PIN domain-containing protein [Myxococcales bacterium]
MVIVVDTSVLVAAWRSRQGASFALVSQIGLGKFEVAVSVPLALEYESALLRNLAPGKLTPGDVRIFVDFICSVAQRQDIFFLWRPMLRDPNDDMVAEVAVAAACNAIITHNTRDFAGLDRFQITVQTPQEFIRTLGDKR